MAEVTPGSRAWRLGIRLAGLLIAEGGRFAARQIWINEREYPCVTYIYDQPAPVHEAHGWTRTGLDGVSQPGEEPHHWQELVYPS